ncbi:MAG TPA: ATP-grasp domain-containing protein [Jatrophihabitans sp.]|jgi:biotin carboxylase|uniref:ATP-grasp domain-containing protein n=1 Tax=Jatrophihabitans sp. TaxID=1932789 RepID=UPI002F00367E
MSALLIIQPVSAGLGLVEAALRQGLRPVVLSFEQEDRTVPASMIEDDAVEVYQVDTNDRAAVIAAAERLAESHDISGVVPGFEYFVPVAAEVAARLGLPGLPPEVAKRVRDKTLMRQALEAAGLAIPQFRVARSGAEVEAAAEEIGYPVVIKPPRAAGSVHVSRVERAEDLRAAYDLLCSETDLDLGNDLGQEVLVESYLDGPEYSAEGYVVGGVATVVSITEKLLSDPPSFVELGHTVPADLPAARLGELADWAATVAEALGVDNALFHLEFRICAGKPFVIELGARMPGDQIANLVALSTGVSLAEVFIQIVTGARSSGNRGLDVDFARTAAIRFFRDPQLDVVTRVPEIAQLRAGKNVENAGLTASVGDRPNSHSDFRSRLGWVVLTASDRLSLEDAWAEVGGKAQFG